MSMFRTEVAHLLASRELLSTMTSKDGGNEITILEGEDGCDGKLLGAV